MRPTAKSPVKPTFLFIGADRCGSKSLHRIFRQHPQVYVPPIADPYFFDLNYERGLDWYYSLFKAAPQGARAIGEFSHDYIHSYMAAERIARDLPEVSLLVSLRHPAERTFSSYAAAYAAGVIRTPFEVALREEPMLIGNSLYADKLDMYFSLFQRSQIKILLFDDLQKDPENFARRAFDFLGLPFVATIDYSQRMSQLSESRIPYSGPLSKIAANLLRRFGWVQLLGRFKSNAFVRNLVYRPYEADSKPAMSAEVRQRLCEEFSPQITRLERSLNLDLSRWRV